MRKRPWVLGLIGGIGSGKSTVAACFANLGAEVIDADRVVHGLLDRPSVRRDIVTEWGPETASGGRVNRAVLAQRAFRNRASIARLNEIVHPRVAKVIRGAVRRSRKAVFVVDAPLLLEAGAGELCDRIVFVDAPVQVRRARLLARGWSPGEMERRERFQWPLARKRAKADYVIDNGRTRAAAARQVRALIRELGLP